MTIVRDGKEIELTHEELEQAYRERELEYRIEDAKAHCEELASGYFSLGLDNDKELIETLDEDDYAKIAQNAKEILEDRDAYWGQYWGAFDDAISEYLIRKSHENA